MADFSALVNLINANINKNGVQAITGNILNGVLRGMVEALGKGYTIAGEATPTTNPGTMTGPVAYIAHAAGTYPHFGNLVVNQGEVAMFIYDEAAWTKNVIASLAAAATVDNTVGTPSVDTTFEDGLLSFAFHNLKGDTGPDGEPGVPAGFGTVTASVGEDTGTPSVEVTTSGPDTAKNIAFAFDGLKGAKGDQGNSGYQGAAGELEVVNNLTDGGATAALSAEMGKYLKSLIDAATLPTEFATVDEDGIFFVDNYLNIGAKIDDNGLAAFNLLTMEDI